MTAFEESILWRKSYLGGGPLLTDELLRKNSWTEMCYKEFEKGKNVTQKRKKKEIVNVQRATKKGQLLV